MEQSSQRDDLFHREKKIKKNDQPRKPKEQNGLHYKMDTNLQKIGHQGKKKKKKKADDDLKINKLEGSRVACGRSYMLLLWFQLAVYHHFS